jgi:uncharacterized protein YjiS (DUF1127 family)
MFHQREISSTPVASAIPTRARRRDGGVAHVGARFVWWLAWPLRVVEARRVMGQLGGLNDRELADVGLRRQDLRDATALPLGADPSLLFEARAHERWRARGRASAGA